MAVGEEALAIVLQALLLCGRTSVGRILDMPCGFGRVARHLRSAFPNARIYGCDLYDDRITFCAEQFGTIPIKSREHFQNIVFPEQFDLIWCGSLLTHLPAALFKEALQLFSRSLAENGLAIITLLGRASPFGLPRSLRLSASSERKYESSQHACCRGQAQQIESVVVVAS
jgi:SAM-dependent methyltransferase